MYTINLLNIFSETKNVLRKPLTLVNFKNLKNF